MTKKPIFGNQRVSAMVEHIIAINERNPVPPSDDDGSWLEQQLLAEFPEASSVEIEKADSTASRVIFAVHNGRMPNYWPEAITT